MYQRIGLFVLAGMISSACVDENVSVNKNSETRFQHETIIQALGVVDQYTFPYVFDSGASVQLGEDEQGNLLVCVIAAGIGDCLFTHERPGEIVSAEIVPHCLVDTTTLSFEIHRRSLPSVFVYFSDGMFTLNRQEAEAWVADDLNCSFAFEANSETEN